MTPVHNRLMLVIGLVGGLAASMMYAASAGPPPQPARSA